MGVMTQEQLIEAFEQGMVGLKEAIKKNPPPESYMEDVVMAGLVLLREVLLDHKRIADALERIALKFEDNEIETLGPETEL